MRHKIPADVKKTAREGLRLRRERGTGNSANRTGYETARALATQSHVNTVTVNRMRAYFSRWEGTKNASEVQRVNWLLWGGDPGRRWVLSF